jgi:hypothetical protein
MRSKCRSSSTLLKNGNAAEKIKTRVAAARQKNRIRILSPLFAKVFGAPELFIKALGAAEREQLSYIWLNKSCLEQGPVSHL